MKYKENGVPEGKIRNHHQQRVGEWSSYPSSN